MPIVERFFDSIEHLEPKCRNCGIKLEYGINTKYNEKKKAHVCLGCGGVLR